jgi:hypothetical protein
LLAHSGRIATHKASAQFCSIAQAPLSDAD